MILLVENWSYILKFLLGCGMHFSLLAFLLYTIFRNVNTISIVIFYHLFFYIPLYLLFTLFNTLHYYGFNYLDWWEMFTKIMKVQMFLLFSFSCLSHITFLKYRSIEKKLRPTVDHHVQIKCFIKLRRNIRQ